MMKTLFIKFIRFIVLGISYIIGFPSAMVVLMRNGMKFQDAARVYNTQIGRIYKIYIRDIRQMNLDDYYEMDEEISNQLNELGY